MNIINIEHISKIFGGKVIFDDVSCGISEGEKIGVIGINGTGKTTLLRVLAGLEQPDEGQVITQNGIRIAYLQQNPAFPEEKTVLSYVTDGMWDMDWTLQSEAKSMLNQLGIVDHEQPLAELSGGQRRKAALVRTLVQDFDVLLLDEPTNHLDNETIEYLESMLQNKNVALLMVTHDRYFLDRITSRTFEMENHRLTVYKGGYTAYLTQKEEAELTARRVYENTMREITRLEGVVAQQRQWNREKNIKTAESKLKVIERLERDLEKPQAAPESIRFQFEIKQPGGNDVLEVEELSLSFGKAPLFERVNLKLRRGERVFLLGPNGCGKTSLFKTILNQYQPDSGRIKLGAGIDLGYYDQIQAGLDTDKTVMDEIWDQYPRMTQTQVRSALAVFLFKGDDVFKPVRALSGGEKAKVLLLKLMLSKANFLLLDEPTNHLDIASREALESALQGYEGTLFVISHDRYLINKIADRVYYLEPGGAEEYQGNYDAFLEKRRQEEEPEKGVKPVPKQNDYKLRKQKESELRKLKTRVRRAEEEIDGLDRETAELAGRLSDPETASDYEKALELTQRMEELRARQEKLMESWEALCQELEEKEAR